MSKKPVITVIGAASTTFGPKVLRDILNHPEVGGCTIRFVDIDEQRLTTYSKLANRINGIIKEPLTMVSTTDRREVLAGSDYVIINVDTGHYHTYRQDFGIPVKHGIRQVLGELGGPGGLFHSLRQIPLHLDIARDIEELCPTATLMVASNPLNRICLALQRHAKVGQILGLCHGAEMSPHLVLNKFWDVHGDDVEFTAAGTNHFTWFLDVRRRSTGEDLYPLLKKVMAKAGPDAPMPLTRKLLEVYGYYPATLDSHFGEYVPYAYEFQGLKGLDFDRLLEQESNRWQYLADLADNRVEWDKYEQIHGDQSVLSLELRLDDFFKPRSWADALAFPILAATIGNRVHRMPALNMLNYGAINNLPDDVFVETPAIVDGSAGVKQVHIGDLPKPLAAFCRRDVDQMELTVEAAVKGDRNLVMQAMLLDPVVDSVSAAERICDEMFKTHARYLPQFA